MATIKSNMPNAKWHELVTACFYQGVDLCVRHMYAFCVIYTVLLAKQKNEIVSETA